MASLVESGMQNLPGGDADSVGFFQMRIGIWNSGDYAGYPEQPELQLDWFLDHAEAVKAAARRARAARSTTRTTTASGSPTSSVPAEQYRGRYQLQLDEARRAAAPRSCPTATASRTSPTPGAGSGPHAGPRAQEAVAEARKYLGTPVPLGRLDAGDGLRLLRARAVGLRQGRHPDPAGHRPADPRARRDEGRPQRTSCRATSCSSATPSGYVHHVGMSLGGDRFIEAPRTGLKVRISSLEDPYYAEQFTGGRRFDPPARIAAAEARVMPALRPEDIDGSDVGSALVTPKSTA